MPFNKQITVKFIGGRRGWAVFMGSRQMLRTRKLKGAKWAAQQLNQYFNFEIHDLIEFDGWIESPFPMLTFSRPTTPDDTLEGVIEL